MCSHWLIDQKIRNRHKFAQQNRMSSVPPVGLPDLRYAAKPASDTANQSALQASLYPTKWYPPIDCLNHGLLDVGDGHRVYYEECGQTAGAPAALYIHGGPGGGCSPDSRRFFDPTHYRIVCHDQRGCGRSIPNASVDWAASIHENNTGKLIEDLEKLRVHLGIEKWSCILGGSWGSTLALAYAQAHPDSVDDIVLRGVFLFSRPEVDYLFRNGLSGGQHPEAWEKYVQFLKDTEKDVPVTENSAEEKENASGEIDYLKAYYRRLSGPSDELRRAAASAFVAYELSISKTFVKHEGIAETLAEPTELIPFALFEVVYMLNMGFLRPGQLINDVDKIKNHRISIVHGRADYVCQPQAAYRLYKALQEVGNTQVNLEFVAGAGHSDSEPGNIDAIVRATDSYRTR